MNQLVLFVLANEELLYDVLAAWRAAGVRRATALDTLGMNRILNILDEKRPIFSSIANVFQNDEYHYTLFAVVDESVDLTALLAATEMVVGDLSQPNTGVFAVLPVSFVKGT